MLRTAALCAACSLFAVPLPAQDAGRPGKWPLRSIAIEGNSLYSDEKLIAATGLRLGEPCDQPAFEAARDRLLATGVLESVAFRFGPARTGVGYFVTFEVAEIEQVYPVRFENMPVPDEEIRAWLAEKEPLFGERVPGTERLVEHYSRLIEEYLLSRGRQEEIRGELTADRPEELYLMFHPKSAMPAIAEVRFTGNTIVTTERLQEAIHGVAIGSRFTAGRMRLLLASTVVPVYELRGRVGVSFPKIEAEPAGGDVNGVVVTVTIEEGESFSFGRIDVRGTASSDQALYDVAGLKSGETANMTEVINALERIRAAMRKKGYMKAQARADRTVNKEAKTVDILITVDSGPQYTFGRLLIEGLDLHGEHEIRRIWGLAPGDPFDGAYPDFFLQQIREQGVFDKLVKTEAKIEPRDETTTVDVTLVFNPKPQKPRFGAP